MEQFKDLDTEVWPISDKVMIASMAMWDSEIINMIKECSKDDIGDRPEFRLID